jgi:hypothetical protein
LYSNPSLDTTVIYDRKKFTRLATDPGSLRAKRVEQGIPQKFTDCELLVLLVGGLGKNREKIDKILL